MSSTIIREKRLISLNSNNATTYNNGSYLSDISFDFFSILSTSDDILYIEGGIQSAQIPCSFYNIDVTNNVFSYTVGGIAYNIQVSPGNYNYNSLTSQMTTLFLINGHTFTFALNRNSNILTMTLTSPGTWNNILPSSIYYILGFNRNVTTTITANTITFPNLFDLLGQKKLKIFSTNLAIDSIDSVGNATNNLIETLSVNQPGFGMLIYNNFDSTYGHLRTSYLSTIDIQIKDELGNNINFNNVNWTMTIVLIVYKELKVTQKTIDGISNEIQA